MFGGAAVAASAATIDSSSSKGTAMQIGAKAPSFELPNSRGDGTTTSLDQLVRGTGNARKWTVLYFYPGAFTQGCTLEARAFQRDIDQYRTLNAQIVGVSVDPPEKVCTHSFAVIVLLIFLVYLVLVYISFGRQ
jgi:thioredoxin-dependent peroxiredoxin